MNIDEYQKCLKKLDYGNPHYIKHNVHEILKRSVHTFDNFCIFQKSSDILQVYTNLNAFDIWVSSKSLVSRRNMYHQIYIALMYVSELQMKLTHEYTKDNLLQKICERKETIIYKIKESNNISDIDDDYIKTLEDKLDHLESKIQKLMQLVHIFVYDKYQDVFTIVLQDNYDVHNPQ